MEQLLKQFNLSDAEIAVYKALAALGVAKVSELATKTKIKRTSCQEVVRGLEEKGFINSAKIGNKYFYQIEDPDTFRQIMSEREFVLDRLVSHVRASQQNDVWGVRALSRGEIKREAYRAKKKEKVETAFGNETVGGILLQKDMVLLWSLDKEIPAIEIKSKAISELHVKLFG